MGILSGDDPEYKDMPTDEEKEAKRQAELAQDRSEHMRMRSGGDVNDKP